MVLLPPPTDQVYENHIHLLTVAQNHCQCEGYALKASRYCYGPEGLFYKINYLCDQGGNPPKKRSTPCVQKHTTSKCKGCPFAAYAVYKKGPPTGWVLIVTNPDHNHAAEPAEAHTIHCLHQLTDEHLEDLETCTWAGMQPGQFLMKLCMQELKIVLGPCDIYNAVAQIRCNNLGQNTPIQALIQCLHQSNDWTMAFQKNTFNQITHFFFCHRKCEQFLQVNSFVLVMNCIYKMNQYNLPLLIIYDKIPLNITFYIVFDFIIAEKEKDYNFHLNKLQKHYIALNLSDSWIIVSDAEQALQNTLRNVFPHIRNHLCCFHIAKNVMIHIKKENNLWSDEESKKAAWFWDCVVTATTVDVLG